MNMMISYQELVRTFPKTGVELYAQHGKTYSGDKMVDDVRTLDYHHIYVDNRTGKEIEWKYSCVEKK